MSSESPINSDLPSLRIFISSPGDVNAERIITERVIERLSEDFGEYVCLEPIFWEHEPMRMTDTFQTQIPPPSAADIFVCILWSRIGTRLPAHITRADGSRYESGTEFEFEDAWQGFDENGKPDILVYRKTAQPPFLLKPEAPDYQVRLSQQQALEAFFRKWFQDEEGSFIRAFNPFDDLAQFEERLESHLYKMLTERFPDSQYRERRLIWKHGSPFRGLNNFEAKHAPIFFGRTRAVGEILNALRKQAQEHRALVMIFGMSGSGKTSLVKAGVMPLLTQAGVIEGVAEWRQVVLSPSHVDTDLINMFATTLLSEDGLGIRYVHDVSHLVNIMRAHDQPALLEFISQRLANIAHESELARQQERLLLVVDQMEKIFTQTNITSQDRHTFAVILSALARSELVWIIGTFRSDFYHRCAEMPELVALMEGAGQFLLTPPSASEIAQIIRMPAQAAGLQYDTHPLTGTPLDEVLLDAMVEHPENLALLEFTLDMLYHARTEDGLLTFAAYEALGGLEGALAQWAEEVFNRVSQEAQEAFPELMRTLVTMDKASGTPVSGRRILDNSDDLSKGLRELLNAFIDAHLLVTDHSEDGLAFARIAHEALLHHWPRLQRWIEEDLSLLRVRAWVNDVASFWVQQGRLPALLIPEGHPLNEAERLYREWPHAIREPAISYIKASVEASQARRLAAEVAAMSKLRRSQHIAATLGGLAVIAIIAGIFGFWQAKEAHRQAEQALRAQQTALQAEKEATTARDVSEKLNQARTANLFESRLEMAALRARTEDYVGARYELIKNRNFVDKVQQRSRSTLRLLEWYTQLMGEGALQVYEGLGAVALVPALSPDGKTLAVGGENGKLALFDVRNGKIKQFLNKHTGDVRSIAFHPQGKWLASSGLDKQIVLWHQKADSDKYVMLLEWQTSERINAVAISPDGDLIATAGYNREVTLWRSAGQEVRVLSGPTKRIAQHSIMFSPDGAMLAAGDYDNNVWLWDVESGQVMQTFSGHAADVENVAFSPDGEMLASSSSDKHIRLWKVGSSQTTVLQGHNNGVFGLRFLSDGDYLVSASRDRSLRIWDTDSGVTMRVLQGHISGLRNIDIHDGEIFSASYDGTVRRWRGELPVSHMQLIALDGKPTSVALTQDMRQVICGFENGSLRLLQTEAEQTESALIWQLDDAHIGRIAAIAVSDDGQWIASAGSGDSQTTVKLWRLGAKALILEHSFSGVESVAYALAFSPDGNYLAYGGYDGKLRIADLSQASKPVEAYPAHAYTITAVNFDSSGERLLTTAQNNIIKLWQFSDGKPLQEKNIQAMQQLTWAGFSHTGKYIFSTGQKGLGEIYDSAGNYVMHRLIGHEDRIQKGQFSPGDEHCLTVSVDSTLRFWNCHDGKELLALPLPAVSGWPYPVWDMDMRCDANACHLAVPLINGRLVLYHLGKIY
jgi:WD40 repeat protein